jgi:molecular chaperone DnaK (HSP70)
VFHPEDPLIPSVVAFPENGPPLVGKPALAYGLTDPENTIFSVKRFMGKGRTGSFKALDHYPFQLRQHEGLLQVRVRNRLVSPQEISAYILKRVKERMGMADQELCAVITVPAYFNDAQRQATRDAAKIAGIRVLRIINEPTAAALAYGLNTVTSGTIAVYDLGGGTFDVSLLKVTNGVFRVLSTHGDTFLGGDDFDEAIMFEWMERHHLDPHQLSSQDRSILRKVAREAKETLTQEPSFQQTGVVMDRHLVLTLNREELNDLIRPFVQKTLESCEQALRDGGKTSQAVDHVILVGGSTRVPLVQDMVERYFGQVPKCNLNPDHVVSLGAAVQARLIEHQSDEMLLMDITPLSLGLETVGGGVTKLIMRNTPIPAQAQEKFTTYVDHQTAMDFHVLQGERELVEDNISLAQFKLKGIPPMSAGAAVVHVHFRIDEDGILTVLAREENSGVEAAIEVIPSHGLSRDKVRQMVMESIEHAQEDFDHVKLIAARTEAEGLMAATRKAMMAHSHLAENREEILEILLELEQTCKTKDTAAIEALTDQLNRATTALAEAMVSSAVLDAVEGKSLTDILAAGGKD